MPILQLARPQLLILAGVASFSLIAYFGSRHVLDQLGQSLAQAQNQASAQQAALAEKEQNLADIRANLGKFRTLEQQGLVGPPDREDWVEQLLAVRKQLGLPETLTYTLKPPVPLGAAPAAAAGAPEATPAGSDTPLTHDLELEIRDVHEEELLALLENYRAKVHGRFRLQSCRLTEPGPSGLTARCVLRFFTLPQGAPKPAGG
ncbi:MAG: hypothetical protein ACM3SV_06945 [Betaproteobacteria bacterium]